MSSEYFVFYLEASLACSAIFAIMLIHDLMGVDRQEKQIKLDGALLALILYFVADTVLEAVLAGSYRGTGQPPSSQILPTTCSWQA